MTIATNDSESAEAGNEVQTPAGDPAASGDRSEYFKAEAAKAFEERDKAKGEAATLREQIAELESKAAEAEELRAKLEQTEAERAAARAEVEASVRTARADELRRMLASKLPKGVKPEAIELFSKDVDLMADGFDVSKAADAVRDRIREVAPQLLTAEPTVPYHPMVGNGVQRAGLLGQTPASEPLPRPRGRKRI